jgi:hypothetical protein
VDARPHARLSQPARADAVIDCTLPIEEAREGLRLLEDREVVGKVVIMP